MKPFADLVKSLRESANEADEPAVLQSAERTVKLYLTVRDRAERKQVHDFAVEEAKARPDQRDFWTLIAAITEPVGE